MNTHSKIDFVITWVDGSDEKWLQEKNKYLSMEKNDEIDYSVERYRDWNLLKFFFRGIEKYANWVNHVYLITDHQIPAWLNLEHEKLSIVFHDDYIPSKYLPTFNSHPIELNLHRISDLEEQFVLFNDDTFIIDTVKPTDFFKNGLPCDSAILSPIIASDATNFSHILINNIQLINIHFNKKDTLENNINKYFSFKYGSQVLRTIDMLPWKNFPGFYNHHLPYSLLKSTFFDVWEKEPDKLDETCSHKFRNNYHDVSPWLLRYWQFASGKFNPRSIKFGKKINYSNNNEKMYSDIRNKKYKVICLNDNAKNIDFITEQKRTIDVFQSILGEKCSYEK